jgi:pimeloyl-ACP methyl ester carboxylesterase
MRFESQPLTVNGIPVQMLTAGAGAPLLFLHGAGIWHGFDFALPWAAGRKVLIPIHPGWPGSGDDASFTSVHDYVMHYLDLIDVLGLDRVDLVGLSMGGRIAAQFAAEHRSRVRKLVLVAPAGLNVPGFPLLDFAQIPPDQILGYLTENVPLIASRAPANPGPEWQAERAQEGASFFRLLPDIVNPHFTRWLHRITVPSLLVWGEKDRVTPIEQAAEWQRWIPGLELHRVPNAGHLVLDEQPEAVEAIARFLAA